RHSTIAPRRGAVALPALAAGLGLAFSLPPWGLWILAFPAAALFWWRLGGLPARTRLWAGWLVGLGYYGPGLAWARAFTLVGALVLIVVCALYIAVGALAVPRGPLLARVLCFPAALTLVEAARMAWPFGGLPLGGVFLGQAGGPVLPVARLGGPLALTAAVYLGGAGLGALAEWVTRSLRDGHRARAFARSQWSLSRGNGLARGAMAGLGGLAGLGALCLVVLAVAVALAGAVPDGGAPVGHVTAAAVQGGGPRGFHNSETPPATVLAAQDAATAELTSLGTGSAPELVLWPEDVVAISGPLAGSGEERALSALARRLGSTLVVGVTETLSNTVFRNEVVAFGPDGRIVSRYEKVHRVPFGEYVPLRGLFSHLADLSAVPRDAVPGTGSGLLPTPAGPLGAMVSYEVFYADRGRAPVRAGAELLIVPTNTSSYATGQVPSQEIAAARVQAVEQGRDLLQAAPTGYSAAVTNQGTVLGRSVLGARQVVFATLALRRGTTPYVAAGDLPVLLLAAAALVTGWLLAWRRGGGRRPAYR
ncbi:MAG: apolipoprotein N-acyltransferase, partial [Acidimicrobiales bacterium]|nr:apolipoprotein N-acyltransferase [Acidimicrobiales bacterium]